MRGHWLVRLTMCGVPDLAAPADSGGYLHRGEPPHQDTHARMMIAVLFPTKSGFGRHHEEHPHNRISYSARGMNPAHTATQINLRNNKAHLGGPQTTWYQ